MAWTSRRLSASGDGVSVLAVLESFLAAAIIIWLVWKGYPRFLIAATIVAPFLLLNTSRSAREALKIAHRLYVHFERRIDLLRPKRSGEHDTVESKPYSAWTDSDLFGRAIIVLEVHLWMFRLIGITIAQFLSFSVAKIFAVTKNTFLHPFEAFSAIPQNWKNAVFQTDILRIPELIPGLEEAVRKGEYDFGPYALSNKRLLKAFTDTLADPATSGGEIFFAAIYLAVIYSYRWAVKSTWPIWIAVIWVFTPLRSVAELGPFMHRIVGPAISKVARWFSIFVLVIFAFKLAIFFTDELGLLTFNNPRIQKLINAYIVPQALPPWQLIGALNGLITLFIFFLADYYIRELQQGQQIPTAVLQRIFMTMVTIRNIGAIYTSLCFAYVTIQVLGSFDLPPLDARTFPW